MKFRVRSIRVNLHQYAETYLQFKHALPRWRVLDEPGRGEVESMYN